MKTTTYHDREGKEIKVSYDENAPCAVCGEPVISASMGGTAICGACDCGKCRYCGISVFTIKEEIDGGQSKRDFLKHMEWHKKHTPELVKRTNDGLRRFSEEWAKRKEAKTDGS